MIDFVKIQVTDKAEITKLYKNCKLIWFQKSDRLKDTEEGIISTKTTKIYNGIIFNFYENHLNILFKPHYYFNNNLHNANDFTINNCINIFRVFMFEFSISKYTLYKIINIEFGVNFRSEKYGKNLISFTEYHRRDQFYNDNELAFSKKSYSIDKEGKMNKYKIIKFYCKGLQFPNFCNINTLRLEVKSKRTKYIKSLKVFNIEDLLHQQPYDEMKKETILTVNNLLIIDHFVNFKKLNKKKENQLKNYLNTHTWYDSIQKSRNTFNQKKKRYFDLLNESGSNVHEELKSIVISKIDVLFENITCADSTPQPKTKKCAYSTIYKGRIRTQLQTN